MSAPVRPPVHQRIKVFTVLGVIGLIAAGVLLARVLPDYFDGVRRIGRRESSAYVGLVFVSLYFLWQAFTLRRSK